MVASTTAVKAMDGRAAEGRFVLTWILAAFGCLCGQLAVGRAAAAGDGEAETCRIVHCS